MNTLSAIPELPRISDYLYYHAERHPEREFAVSGGERLSYAGAAERVGALSRALLKLGVSHGDRVAMLSTPRAEFPIAFLATVDIGAIWVGLNPKYQLAELTHVVRDAMPKVLIGLTEHRGRCFRKELQALHGMEGVATLVTIRGQIPGAGTLEELIARGRDVDDAARLAARSAAGGRQPALVVYTSGTTGTPKGAVLTHKSLVWSFLRQAKRWAVDPMRVMCNLPINHSGCVGDILSTCLTAGGTLVMMEDFDAELMLELIAHEQVNALMQIPTMYQLLAKAEAFASADLSSLKIIVWGGAAMPRAVMDAFARDGLAMEVTYGLTESPASVTYSDRDATPEQLTETIGRPDPEIEVRLARPDASVSAQGEAGEIQVRHPSVLLGYFGNAQASAQAFTSDGFLRTGDLAVQRPDGDLELVGRIKEMFKSGGYNVYPREIELCLERHPEVMTAVVVSVPDALFGEVGHAFVVPRPGAKSGPGDIAAWCRTQLANYKIPKTITFQDELPLLPIGKPDKGKLRAAVQERVRVAMRAAPETGRA